MVNEETAYQKNITEFQLNSFILLTG